MAKTKEANGKPLQEFLPGMEPQKNKRIHERALKYEKLRDARMEALKLEVEAQKNLMVVMEEEKVNAYEYGDLKVFIDEKRKVKVKRASADEEDGDDA